MTTGEVVSRRGVPSIVPMLNPVVQRLLRVGMPMGPNVLLTVRGRTSGQPRTFPVALMESGGRQFVFATFGEVDWVRNLRIAGAAVLRRGRRNEAVVAVELPAEEAARVMADALAPLIGSPVTAPLLRRWYDLARDSSPADYLAEARHHPVFELRHSTDAGNRGNAGSDAAAR
jgi:deazaflavin-dependent oxidoreductase (nitroreductase family)